MSDAPVFSKGRNIAPTAAALRPWLAERLGAPDVELDGFDYPRGAGVSNETIMFEARWRDGAEQFVLRPEPAPQYQMFLETDFRMQYDLLTTLRRGGWVRVPEVLWFEEDRDVIGQRFFIMRRMQGRVPVSMPVYNSTGWLFEATPAQRRRLWESAMDQFTAIHRVPVGETGFVQRPDQAATGVAQQLAYWTKFRSWVIADNGPDPVTPVLDWLETNQPDEPPGLSWGDARMGNMMFGDDFQVVGVMDWEQASLSGGAADLGWWLHFDEIHSVDQGVPRLDGLGSRQETIDLWESLTGLSAGNLLWHEVFAGVKTALLSMHSRRILNLAAVEHTHSNPFLERSYRLVDLPMPASPA